MIHQNHIRAKHVHRVISRKENHRVALAFNFHSRARQDPANRQRMGAKPSHSSFAGNFRCLSSCYPLLPLTFFKSSFEEISSPLGEEKMEPSRSLYTVALWPITPGSLRDFERFGFMIRAVGRVSEMPSDKMDSSSFILLQNHGR